MYRGRRFSRNALLFADDDHHHHPLLLVLFPFSITTGRADGGRTARVRQRPFGRDVAHFGREVHLSRHRRIGWIREFENAVAHQMRRREFSGSAEPTRTEEAERVAKPNLEYRDAGSRGKEVSETGTIDRVRQPETDESGGVYGADGVETVGENRRGRV